MFRTMYSFVMIEFGPRSLVIIYCLFFWTFFGLAVTQGESLCFVLY